VLNASSLAISLELRAEGHSPDDIVHVMGDDYMLYAYSGDILSFLDQSVRTLEAAEALAKTESGRNRSDELYEAKRELTDGR